MATQSMPMVLCLLAILATMSLVPTPSVPEMRTGSLYPREARSKRPPKPPIPPTTPGRFVRATCDLMRLTTSYPASTLTPAFSYACGIWLGLSTYSGSPLEGSCRRSRLRGGCRLRSKSCCWVCRVVRYLFSGCTVLYSLPMYLLLYSANSGRRTRSSGVRDFRKSAS